MHGEVVAAQVLGADVGDEGLMSRAAEALADLAIANSTQASVACVKAPAASTRSQANAHSIDISARAGMRLRPSIQRETTSCATTIAPGLKAKTTSISPSPIRPWSRANCGRRLTSD